MYRPQMEYPVTGHDEDGCEVRTDKVPFCTKMDEVTQLQGLLHVTNEDWYGTFSGGRLYSKLVAYFDGGFGVVVSGNDDFAMYKYGLKTRDEAEGVLRRIPVPITEAALKAAGFVRD